MKGIRRKTNTSRKQEENADVRLGEKKGDGCCVHLSDGEAEEGRDNQRWQGEKDGTAERTRERGGGGVVPLTGTLEACEPGVN